MKISEIYRGIQGESTFSGLPCTFIRTAGCNLRCQYCDTGYALEPRAGEEMSLDAILKKTQKLGIDLVEITGGEPLEQEETPDLCSQLLKLGSTVLIETSGAYRIDTLPDDVITILDIKTPSSLMEDRNEWANMELLDERDEVKFVICDRGDFDWALSICDRYNLLGRLTVLFSPSFNELKPRQLAEWILETRIPIRMQLQTHKYIWDPTSRKI